MVGPGWCQLPRYAYVKYFDIGWFTVQQIPWQEDEEEVEEEEEQEEEKEEEKEEEEEEEEEEGEDEE